MEAQLLEMDGIDLVIWKVTVLILLFRSELPHSTSSLVHMTDRNKGHRTHKTG